MNNTNTQLYQAQPWLHSNYSQQYDHSAYNLGSCKAENPYHPDIYKHYALHHNKKQQTSNNIQEKYLAILGLDLPATESDIQKAHKKLSSKYNPQKARNEQDKEARTMITTEVKDAYKYLMIILDSDDWRNRTFN